MTPDVFSTATVKEPGLYRLTEAEYHSDPCPEPSLSRSIAQVLIEQSPRHAWTAHPRLNPDWQPDEASRRADIGSACHAKLLDQKVEIAVIDADEYRTTLAKVARDNARERGAIPLLMPDAVRVDAIIRRAREELATNDHPAIRDLVDPGVEGVSFNEISACWRDRMGDRWCRSRMDRLAITPGRVTIIDYKTTEMSAAPADVKRAIFNNAYHLQDGFYRRGLRHLIPEIDQHEVTLDFLFIVQEQRAPHAVTVARIDAAGRIIGEKMASVGVRMWDRAVRENTWPGYPTNTVVAEMPAYVETQWCAREIEDPRMEGLASDPFPQFEQKPYAPTPIVAMAG